MKTRVKMNHPPATLPTYGNSQLGRCPASKGCFTKGNGFLFSHFIQFDILQALSRRSLPRLPREPNAVLLEE